MKAVIFDLGNVLVSYDHRQTLTALATLCRCDVAGIRALFAEVDARLGVGELDTAGLYQFCRQKTGLETDLAPFVAALCSGLARNDEALHYAVALQQRPGVTIGVISNTIEAHVAWLDEHIPELAELDLVMMSNEVGLTKPNPEVFHLALDLLDTPAQQALFVDDLAANVAAAQRLGLHGIVHSDWSITRPALECWLADTPAP